MFNLKTIVCSLASLSSLIATGCKKTNTIVLPSDMHGAVVVSCFGETNGIVNIVVDPGGLAVAKSCPKEGAVLRVVRSGKDLLPVTPPKWIRDHNGTVIAITFEMR